MPNKPNILIVDDVAANIVALKRIITNVDVNILSATSGEEALRLAMEKPLALALLDVMMPNMNGFELAELLQGSPKNDHVPIIFVTANAHDENNKIKGYSAGAVDYITKPINTKILQSKVAVFLDLYQHQQQHAQLNLELEKSNAAKNKFIETISHELRTPMNGTLGMLGLALSTELNEKQKSYLENALESSNNLLEIIDNIYEFNMVENNAIILKETRFDPAKLLQYCTDISNERITLDSLKGHITVHSEFDSPIDAYADTTIITEVLNNLTQAALNTSKNKELTITGKLTETDNATSELIFKINDPSTFLSVKETKNLFTSFNTATHNRGDAQNNLSLAISDAIIRQMGGKMDATSSETYGTTYSLSLPIKITSASTTSQTATS